MGNQLIVRVRVETQVHTQAAAGKNLGQSNYERLRGLIRLLVDWLDQPKTTRGKSGPYRK